MIHQPRMMTLNQNNIVVVQLVLLLTFVSKTKMCYIKFCVIQNRKEFWWISEQSEAIIQWFWIIFWIISVNNLNEQIDFWDLRTFYFLVSIQKQNFFRFFWSKNRSFFEVWSFQRLFLRKGKFVEFYYRIFYNVLFCSICFSFVL